MSGKRTSTVDWNRARTLYLEDSTRTFSDIGEMVGVSRNRVQQVAAKQGWRKIRDDLSREADKKIQEQVVEDLSKMNKDHLEAFSEVVDVARKLVKRMMTNGGELDTKAEPGELMKAANALKVGVEGQRVIAGLPIIIAKSESRVDIDKPPREHGEAEETMDALDARKERFRKIMAKDEPVDGKPQDKEKAKA